jgi:DNA-binding SARP family transcriptional activator
LLAYMILHHDRAIPRERLTGLFWPERATQRARRALSHVLWQIRRALGPAANRIVTEHDAIIFVLCPGDRLDVEQFEAFVKTSINSSGASAADTHNLESAVALYRADFLSGCYDDWALVERERLRELYLRALERLITMHKRRSDYEHALAFAQRLAAADPLREAAHRELMRLYHLLDRPRAALEQFATLCSLLAEELGVSPSHATVALREEIAATLEELRRPHLPIAPPPPPLLSALADLPFVGRTNERTALIDALQAANRGHGGVALVEGEAGVGKTRLIDQVVAGARWRGFQVALAKADSIVAPAPYQLLRDALLPLLTPLRTAQLAELVDPLWLAVTAPILPPVAEHLSQLPSVVSLAPAEEQQRLCQGLAHCVTGLASVAPLLLVTEDVQWADEATLKALSLLVPEMSARRVLVILTCRTAEARARPPVWEALDALDRALSILRLPVGPFDRSDAVCLVQRALGTDGKDIQSAELGRRLQEKTGGNALFLVESLESLLEQGALGLVGGSWRFPSADLSLPTPASLREVIDRRLTRLSPAMRTVLEHVAVMGEDADFPVLSRAIGGEPAQLTIQLRTLDERGFLTETSTGYRFQHDVIRDAVYQDIPPCRRQALHRHIGEALEELRPEKIESLALHFERGEAWLKAVHHYRQAGARARSVYAAAQAVEYYDRALGAWKRLPAPDENLGLHLHGERGRICQDRGWFDQAEADFRAAQSLAERTGDGASQARILNDLSYLSFQRGDFEEAAGIAQQALDLGVNVEHEPEIAAALFNQANALRNLGNYREAIHLYERAATVFERLDDQTRLADCLNRMGAALNHIGAFVKAHALMKRSLTIRRRLEDKRGISYSLLNLAIGYYYMGRFDRVREVAQEALEIATDIGDPYGQDAALHDLGVAALEQGLATEAIPFFQRALTIAREIGDKALEPEVLAEMARSHQQLGDLDKAQELLEQSLGMVSVSVEQNYVPPLHAYLALLYLDTRQDDRAVNHARAGLREAEKREDLWSSGLTHRVMGHVIGQLGRGDAGPEPVIHFEKAIDTQRQIGAEAELARTMVVYGLHLRRLGASDDARRTEALLEEARTLFRKLGMAADLARLEGESRVGRPPTTVGISLPLVTAPTGRPLHDDEFVDVSWTVAALEDEEIPGKADRRRYRVLRLLREAAEHSAAPAVEHLAAALDVSARTIKRDLATLRAQGHDVRTRGSR